MNTANEGDIAIVTTRRGRRYTATWTLAPGIDYFWSPILPDLRANQLFDPVVSFSVIMRYDDLVRSARSPEEGDV